MNYENTMIENVAIAGVDDAVRLAYETMEVLEEACGEFFTDECSAEAEAAGIFGIHSILTRGVGLAVDPGALPRLRAHIGQLSKEGQRMQRFSEVALGWLFENHPEAVEFESEDIMESGDEEAQMLDVAVLIKEGGKIASITVNFAEMPEVVA